MRQRLLTVLMVVSSFATLPTAAHAALSVSTQSTPPAGFQVLLASPAPAEPGSYVMTHGTGMAVGVGQTFRFDRVAQLDRTGFLP